MDLYGIHYDYVENNKHLSFKIINNMKLILCYSQRLIMILKEYFIKAFELDSNWIFTLFY